jgi:hypothetical protein
MPTRGYGVYLQNPFNLKKVTGMAVSPPTPPKPNPYSELRKSQYNVLSENPLRGAKGGERRAEDFPYNVLTRV